MQKPILKVHCCCEKKQVISVRIAYTLEKFKEAYVNKENLVAQNIRCHCGKHCRFELPANCFEAVVVLKSIENPEDFPEGFLENNIFPTQPLQE